MLPALSDKISLGDMDGDGDLDVATTSGVYLNTGTGTFRNSPQATSAGTTLGDVDGDGDLDAMLPAGSTVEVRRNNGSGVFSSSPPFQTGLNTVTALILGDVDGTGSLDVVAVGDNNASISLNQPVSVPPTTATRLNAGGLALATTRGAFAADHYFSANSATTTSNAPIAGTSDDALYQSERYSRVNSSAAGKSTALKRT